MYPIQRYKLLSQSAYCAVVVWGTKSAPQNDQDRGSNYRLVISQDKIYSNKDIFNVKTSKH